jgi:hypothetical protein
MKVPSVWQTKQNYRPSVYEMINKDNNFLDYLCATEPKESKKIFPKPKDTLFVKLEKTEETPRINTETINNSKFYSITHPNETEENLNLASSKDNHTYTTLPPLHHSTQAHPKHMKRQSTMRGSMLNFSINAKSFSEFNFRNLTAKNFSQQSPIITEAKVKKSPSPQKKKQKSIHKEKGSFINIDYDKIYKKIEVKNPAIKKLLQDIDYYGPHFSHCPSCKNKNLEFFKNMESGQAIKLLTYIRDNKTEFSCLNSPKHTKKDS